MAAAAYYLSMHGCENQTMSGNALFSCKNAQKSYSLTIKSRPRSCKVTMKMVVAPKKMSSLKSHGKHESNEDLAAAAYDEWMRESVSEIVKNLREAPLLVQVYGEGTRLYPEKAVPEEWDLIKRKWETRESPFPEGIIFVEELKEEFDSDCDCENESDCSRITRAWGIVVQGRGGKYAGPACYLLKTSRVGSGLGLGCTHFCLTKVRDFREVVDSQFKNCWLL